MPIYISSQRENCQIQIDTNLDHQKNTKQLRVTEFITYNMSKEKGSSRSEDVNTNIAPSNSSSPDNLESSSLSSFGNVGDHKKEMLSSSMKDDSDRHSTSRSSTYQMWNANSNTASSISRENKPAGLPQQSQLQEVQPNFFLPSEFESLAINEGTEPKSAEPRASSLAVAANRRMSTSSVSSIGPDQPQKLSSLSSAARDQNMNQVNTMKIVSAPPGFHSPISVNPSNKGRNQSRVGNPPNRGSIVNDFRLKDQRISKQDNRRFDLTSQSDNHSGKWSSASSQHSQYSAYSSASIPVAIDRNRRGGMSDDISYRSHASMRSEASYESAHGSSLLRYVNSSQSVSSGRSGRGDNLTVASSGSSFGGSYKRNERAAGASATHSSSAVQKMLAQASVSPEAIGLGTTTLPSLTASSVYSDIDDQNAKKASGGGASFSLPPHSFLPGQNASGSDTEVLDRNYLEHTLGDEGSKTSRSSISTPNRSKGKNKDWRLKMNRMLAETPIGEVDSNEIPISVLMNVSFPICHDNV